MTSGYFFRRPIKIILIILLFLAVILFLPGKFFDPVRLVFLEVAYPFQKVFYLAGEKISSAFGFVGSISDMREENEKLIIENNTLAAKVAGLEVQKKENDEFREQLKLLPRNVYDLESAWIIGRNPNNPGSWILVDKGSRSGIKKGMPVIAFEGILVGLVDEVLPDQSKIILLSDSASLVNAMDMESGSKGIVRGEYGLGILLDMLSHTEAVNGGDTVVTSGLSGSIPKGLLVGKIQHVRLSDDKLFQQAAVAPRIKYTDLNMIFIIK